MYDIYIYIYIKGESINNSLIYIMLTSEVEIRELI